MTEITIAAAEHPLRGYLQTPMGKGPSTGPWPGIVVIHDVFGQTDDNRRQVDWLAASGYIALSPDLYTRGNKLRCIQATMRDLLARQGNAFADIEAARATLASREDCTGKVGVIGFCMGGGFALLLAASGGYAASSVNYGQVPKDAEALLRGACPVVGSFGAKDKTLKGAAARLETALRGNGVAHDVKEYPGAGHAFINDHQGALGWVMARFGAGLNEPAAADAKARILAFFGEHLR